MASIKNSLRKIYTALGGTTSKSKTITGLLDDISTVASSGGGDSNLFITTFIQDNNFNITTDVKFSELLEAYEKEKIIIGVVNADNNGDITEFCICDEVFPVRGGPGAPISSFKFAQYKYSFDTKLQSTTIYLIENSIVFDGVSASMNTKVYSFDATTVQ